MKKKSKTKLPIIILLAVAVVGISAFVYDGTSNTDSAEGKTFSIPTFAFAGATSSNINPDITCNVKHEGYAIDSAGNVLKNFQSSLASGNPLLDLTDNGKTMAGYVIQLKMFCGNNVGVALEVQPSTMTMNLVAKDPNNNSVQIAQKSITTKKTTFESGDGEKIIGFFSVYASEVENKLPKTPASYTSLQEFQTFGKLEVNWRGYSSITYDVPIPVNSMKSFHNAKIINDSEQLDPELADSDGDGIINKFDDCDNQRENFNGYQDGDGCPDVNPTTNDNQSDNNDPLPSENPADQCSSNQVYVDAQGICVDQDDPSAIPTLDGKMLWQVDVRDNSGGNFAFVPQDDPSPFSFSIPLNDIVGGKNIGEKKIISEITAQVLLKFNDPSQHNLISTTKSNVNYKVLIGVGDKSNPTWITVKDSPAQDFISKNGASAEAGMSLGNIQVRASEIEGKISASLVPIGEYDNLQIKIIASGDAGIRFNDGGVLKDLSINIQESECTQNTANSNGECPSSGLKLGESTGNTNFVWTNLVISRGIDGTSGNTSTNSGSGGLNCEIGTQNKITNKATGESFCIDIGTTANDSNPDPKIGEQGVLICVDDVSGQGGFPCTEDYRIAYCGGVNSTECGTPEENSNVSGDDCTGNDCEFIIDQDGSDSTSIPQTNGDDVACTTNGVNTLDLSDKQCMILQGQPQSTSDNGNFCIGSNCQTSTDNTLIYAVGILAVIGGVIALIIKKRQ